MAYNERLENPRYELIGGEEVMLARPLINHDIVQGNLRRIIGNYLLGKRCDVFGEVDVYFDEDNHYVPDVIIVCDSGKVKPDGIYGAPDLVVEILSPRTMKRDIGIKKDIYEQFGVKEYWLVNPKDKSVTVYHLQEDHFVLDNVYSIMEEYEIKNMTEKEKTEHTLTLKVSLYDDLMIDVQEIFRGMKPI